MHSLDHLPSERAFSLVEVVLALGVVAISIIPLVALLPTGLGVNRASEDETAAVNIMTMMINDRRCSPLTGNSTIYNLASLSPTMGVVTNAPIYLDESYTPISQSKALYVVKTVFTPPPTPSLAPYLMYCQVGWPAQAATPQGLSETVAAIPQTSP